MDNLLSSCFIAMFYVMTKQFFLFLEPGLGFPLSINNNSKSLMYAVRHNLINACFKLNIFQKEF